MAWFEHSIRWVLITAFGAPAEPEVNRNLARVSGQTAAGARSTAPADGAASSAKDVVCRPGTGLRVSTSSAVEGITASIARANSVPSLARTRPGVSTSTMVRSLAKSLDMSEYAGEIGA